MKCPFCAYLESKVVDSRPADEGASIRRRRECLSCHKRFTTYETMESLPLMVVKKDGSRQSFDRNKVMNGLIRACEKRPVSFSTMEEIEMCIRDRYSDEYYEVTGREAPKETDTPNKTLLEFQTVTVEVRGQNDRA